MHRHPAGLAALAFCILLLAACAPSAPPPTPSSIPLPTQSPPTAIPPSPTPEPTATPDLTFRDEFDATLAEGWTWIREQPELWSLGTHPGYMTFIVPSGEDPGNSLVRDAPGPNFEISTHLKFTPDRNFQIAGLLVYESDQTTATLGRAFCGIPDVCKGNALYFDAAQDGQYGGNNFATVTSAQDQAFLRLVMEGTTLTGYYSEDGKSWTTLGQHSLSLQAPKVGLMSGRSGIPGVEAVFDYFELVELP